MSDYAVIAEYEGGGKDVQRVVDIPGIAARDAWDEYEDVYRYVPYTAAERAKMRIEALKTQLAETDYAVIKIAEGAATAADYAELIAQRQTWRAEINDLEGQIDD